jgi:hypothetical protein
MGVSTSPAVTADPAVYEFLKQHSAEAAFQTVCEIVREIYPETRAIQASAFEDWDEPGWMRVRVAFFLPERYPADEGLRRHAALHERLAEKLPDALQPLFLVREEYFPEST